MTYAGNLQSLVSGILASGLLIAAAAWVDAAELQEDALRPFATWRFNESSDGICRDSGERKLDGRYFNGASVRQSGTDDRATGVSFVTGGQQRRVEIPLDAQAQQAMTELLSGAFTLEAWIRDNAPKPNGRTNFALVYKADRSAFTANSLWFYRARQDGSYRFRITDSDAHEAAVDLPPLTPSGEGDGKWHHCVVVVDRSSADKTQWVIRAYRDGQLVSEGRIPSDLKSPINDGAIILGNDHRAASPWQGAIDDVAWYSVALTPEKVLQRYEMSASPSAPEDASVLLEKEEFFEAKIRPLLIAKCAGCHSGDEFAESPLAFSSRHALLKGADFGPSIVPGKSAESLLVQAVQWTHKALKMPPEAEDRLARSEIEDLRRWIDQGAFWPESQEMPESLPETKAKANESVETDHWAFQPRSRPLPPQVADPAWRQTEIDRFLFAKMTEQGITPTTLADRTALIRRATFDLIGLPPTPEEVNAFLHDKSDDAFAHVVDRLLASPHYGERWGRHWLDLARYADTQGDVGDFPIPQAYLYRNWVIDALNADLPYDQFIQAQLAGDLIAPQSPSLDEAKGLMAATGFVALSRRFGNTKHDDQHLTIEDTIDTLGRSVLGITIRCARCHDHKFDPILQSDYFGLYGIFQSTRYPTMGASNEKSPSALTPVTPDREEQRELDEYFDTIERYAYQINNHFRPWLKPTLHEYGQVRKQLENQELSEPAREQLETRREALLASREGAFRELMLHGLNWIKTEKNKLADNPPTEMLFALSEGEPVDTQLHLRGNPENLGQVVKRRFPLAATNNQQPGELQGSGRLELARWITEPQNPLTARVMINRIWQHHFGRGLVSTPSNFGVRGAEASHPELLDYLANTFVEQDHWSLKATHRRLMLTRAYQQSSEATPASVTADPDNVYLGRHERCRLEAESIRDAILAISGRLDRSQGAGFPFPHWKQPQFSLNNPFKAEYPSQRRSVYLMSQRLFRHPFFALFDGPDRSQSTEERTSSTLPTQVLYLLNSSFVQAEAEALADRLLASSPDDSAAVTLAFELVYGRSPTSQEQLAMIHYIDNMTEKLSETEAAKPLEIRRRVWTGVAKSLFASNEFLFVE